MVALRVWATYLRNGQHILEVRSDSVTALIMLSKIKAKSDGLNMIAREVSLDLACGTYQPHAVHHLPGVANATPYVLSRLPSPPAGLEDAEEVQAPLRTSSFYVAARAPARRRVRAWLRRA